MRIVLSTISRWARKQTKLIGGTGAGVIIGLAGTAIVAASIPGPNGVIKSCVKANGDVKIIDSAATCPSSQQTLNWNQTGPQGPAGPTGPTGPQGPAGTGGSGSGLLSNLVGADFSNASLQYRDLTNLDLHDSKMVSANLTGASLVGSNLTGIDFGGAIMAKTDMHGNNLSGSIFRYNFRAVGANFSGADFTNTTIYGYFGFSPIDLTDANFQQALFTGTVFGPQPNCGPDCTHFMGGDFTNAHFLNATLTGMHFTNTNFTGATWSNTACPDGTNSDNNGNTCVGHLIP